jgi:hypothetical protein
VCVCLYRHTYAYTYIHTYTHIHQRTVPLARQIDPPSLYMYLMTSSKLRWANFHKYINIYICIMYIYIYICMYVCILTRRHTTLTYIMIDFVFPTKKTRVSIADLKCTGSRFDLSVFVQKSTNTVFLLLFVQTSTNTVFLLLKKGHFVSESVIHVCVCHTRVTYVCTYDIT